MSSLFGRTVATGTRRGFMHAPSTATAQLVAELIERDVFALSKFLGCLCDRFDLVGCGLLLPQRSGPFPHGSPQGLLSWRGIMSQRATAALSRDRRLAARP